MRLLEPENRRRQERQRLIRSDLAYRALLVATLWVLLRLLDAELNSVVVIAVLVAVFGPDVGRAAKDLLLDGPNRQ